jgi:hypothetical protein
MKEILKEVFQHCLDMQKMAETKNAGLIAFNGCNYFGSYQIADRRKFKLLLSLLFVLCFILLFDFYISKPFSNQCSA